MGAVNLDPVITNLSGDIVAFVLNQGPVALDAAGIGTGVQGVAPIGLGLTDADSTDFDGGVLRAEIVAGGAVGEDVLRLDLSRVSLSGGDDSPDVGETVSVGGVAIGTIAAAGDGRNGNPLSITLNALATPALVQTLATALQYTNSNATTPATNPRSVRVTVSDGEGGLSPAADVTVRIALPKTMNFEDSGQRLGASSDTQRVALADVDGDGDLDAFAVNDGAANRLWLNDGAGSFTDSGQDFGSNSSGDAAFGDMDGDGDLDLMLGSGGTTTFWSNDGSGTFGNTGSTASTDSVCGVYLGDLDADGDLDFVAANRWGASTWWLNDGAGSVTHAGTMGSSSERTSSGALGDLDGDGDLDFYNFERGTVWQNNGTGGLGMVADYDHTGTHGVLADFDGDGDLDGIMYTSAGELRFLWNDGSANLTQGAALTATYTDEIAVVDIEGDGDLDVVAIKDSWGVRSHLWLNDGSGGFSDGGEFLTGNQSAGLGDFDRDGDVDVFWGNDGVNQVWLNADLVPRLTGLDGDRVAAIPGGAPVHLDARNLGGDKAGETSPAAALLEAADTDFDGGTVSVTINNNHHPAEDVLTLDTGLVTLSGGDASPDAGDTVTVDGVVIGSIAAGGDGKVGNDLVVELGAGADPARTETLIRALQYTNTNATDPATGPRTLGVILTDGASTVLADHSVTIDFQAPDAPGTFVDADRDFGWPAVTDALLGDVDGDGDLDMFAATDGWYKNNTTNRLYFNDGTGVFTDSGQALGDGNYAHHAAFGDFDGDGDLDLVTMSGTKVWLNDGTGLYTDTGQSFSGGDRVTTGDLDGDGDLDIFTSSTYGPEQALLNDGTGTFTVAWTGNANGSNADGIHELGDIDGDGDLDYVQAGSTSWVWMNRGNGTFDKTGTISGYGAHSVALADFDGDGDLDLALGGAGQVYILRGDGSGGFTDSGQSLSWGSGWIQDLAVADINGDGTLDIFAASESTGERNRVLLNDGNATFTDSTQMFGPTDTQSVVLGDLDHDGDIDAVLGTGSTISSHAGYNVVWLNMVVPEITNLDGDRVSFTQGQGAVRLDAAGTGTDSHGMAPLALGFADADSPDLDGGTVHVTITNNHHPTEDLLTLDESGTVAFEANAAGAAVSVEGTVIGTLANDIAVGNDLVVNLNSNATPQRVQTLLRAVQYENVNTTDPDIDPRTARVTVSDGDGASSEPSDVTITMLRPAAAEFHDTAQTLGGTNKHRGALGDVDGDGDLDVMVSRGGVGNVILLNAGTGTLTDSGQLLGTENTRDVALGDLDGDGDLDAFETVYLGANRVWLNDGSGVFADSGQSLGSARSFATSLGDVDGDGDLDAVVGNYLGDGNAVWLNDGAGTFIDSGQALGSWNTLGIALGDVDGDGDLDIFTANEGEANRVWVNDGNGAFADSGQAMGTMPSTNVALGDFNGDGSLDAFVTNLGEHNEIWLNDGVGGFSDSGEHLSDARSNGVSLGDLDSDGDLDAFVANENALGVSGWNMAWLNDGSGRFGHNGQQLGTASSIDALLGDLDGDGDLDAYVVNEGGSDIVWINAGTPAIADLDGDAVEYTEDSPAIAFDQDSAALVSDGDTPAFDGGRLVATLATGVASEDLLGVRNQGTGAGQIGVSGSDVSYEGTVIGTMTGGASGTPLVVTLNARATHAATSALIANLTYANSDTVSPTEGARSVQVTLSDGTGQTSEPVQVTVNVTAVNDAPSFDVGTGMATADFGSTVDQGQAVAIQDDGKIVVAGNTRAGGSGDDVGLLRLDATGERDASFGAAGVAMTPAPSSGELVGGVAIQSDGKIVVAGRSDLGGTTNFMLVRYDADGSADTSFGGGDGFVNAPVGASHSEGQDLAIQSDGKIVVGGYGIYSGSDSGFTIARYNADGSLDTGFGGSGTGWTVTNTSPHFDYGHGVTLQPDGKILLTGESYNGLDHDVGLVRYNADGTLDTSFGGGDGIVTTSIGERLDYGQSVAVQADGKIVVGGQTSIDGTTDVALFRYNADGTLDTTFGGGDGIVTADLQGDRDYGFSVQIQPDGKLLVGGPSSDGDDYDFALARFETNGVLDTSFGIGGIATADFGGNNRDDWAGDMKLMPDGKIVLAGYTSDTSGNIDYAVARFNADGTLDTSFGYQSSLDGTPVFDDGGPAVALDDNATLSDPEFDEVNGGDGNWTGATLTVTVDDAGATDALGFGTMAGVTVVGNSLVAGGNTYASFTGVDSGTLVISFSDTLGGVPTTDLVNETLRGITYENTSQDLPAGDTAPFTVRYSLTDGPHDTSGAIVGTIVGVDNDDVLTGTPARDTLSGGVGNDRVYGLGDDDTLDGGIGDDLLDGGTGADMMSGGAGDDTYVVDNAGDTVAEAAGEGTETVQTSLGEVTLADEVENLTYTGGDDFTGTGNAGNNQLLGGTGSDTLFGLAGDDVLDGGAGRDRAVFTGKVKTLVNLNLVAPQDTGHGLDSFISIEEIQTGNGADRLTGDAGGNTLVANGGNDKLFGLDGDDALNGGLGRDVLKGGTGIDEAVFARNRAIKVSLATTKVQNTGEGKDRLIGIEDVTTGNGRDVLKGNGAANGLSGGGNADRLQGKSGGDVLNGDAGNDLLDGGKGKDTAVYLSGADVTVKLTKTKAQNTGEGRDRLVRIENLQSGDGDDTLVGNKARNVLDGGDGNDFLKGAGGSDRLLGGLGDDRMFGGKGGDVFVFETWFGTDTIADFETGPTGDVLDFSAVTGTRDDLLITATGDGTGTVVTLTDTPFSVVLENVLVANFDPADDILV